MFKNKYNLIERNKTAGDKFALQNIPSKGLHRFAAADKKDLLQPA